MTGPPVTGSCSSSGQSSSPAEEANLKADNTHERYTSPRRYVGYKPAEERTVQYMRYWHSLSGGQAVVVQFTDGTQIRLGIEPLIRVETEIGVLRDEICRMSRSIRRF